MFKSWWQHPTKHQLYGHLPPITKTIQVRRTRHAGYCWRNRDEFISDVLLWTPTYGRASEPTLLKQALRKAPQFGLINHRKRLIRFNSLSERRIHFHWIKEEFSSPTEWLLNPEIKLKLKRYLLSSSPFFPSFRDSFAAFYHIYPTPPLGQDMTQGQFLSGV